MPDLISVTGQHIDTIIKIDDVDKENIVLITGQTPPPPTAKRWMGGGRLGYLYTTSASNGATGWNQGTGIDGSGGRGGYVADIGNGLLNSVGYGYVDPTADPLVERWVYGLENAGGASGTMPYINSQSCQPADLDGAGRPTYASASNYVSGTGNGASVGLISNGQIMYGNGVWIRGGKWLTDGGDRHVIGRSTDGGNTFVMIDMNNTIQDYCRAIGYEGGNSGNWLAVVQSHVWKSLDNGATWTDLGALDGTKDWYSMAYDGVGRWVIVGASGDGFTSIVPIVDMTAEDLSTQWTALEDSFAISQNLYGLVYMKGSESKWVTCGEGGKILTYAYTSSNSDRGNNWTVIDTPDVTSTLTDIATDHTTIVVVGESGVIFAGDAASNLTQLNKTNDGIGTEQLRCISCDIIGAGKVND
mgnify:FL=1|jgi:hypothetical protein